MWSLKKARAPRKRGILARANNSCAFNRSLTILPNEIHGAQLCSLCYFILRLFIASEQALVDWQDLARDWGLNRIKIEKTLNRCNSQDNEFLSTSERSLEAWNFLL